MPPIHMLIKPASSICNMRCGYCFYREEANARATASYGLMSRETMEAVVRRAFEADPSSCHFGFQGGEPTLAGRAFFEAFVGTVARLNQKRRPVTYAIQTNGLLVDDAWAAFFKERRFLVGLSLDGPAEMPDRFRADAEGKGTFGRVMQAASALQRQGAEFNILTVVNAETARHVGRAYRFFRKNQFYYQQYIACLDPPDQARGGAPYSLTPALYGRFLIDLFHLWDEDLRAGRPIYIRYFENLVGMLAGRPPEACGMAGVCALQWVVEADGGVYPCDFYAMDAYRLGNLCDQPLARLAGRAEDFLNASRAVSPKCAACEYSLLCRGGCRRDREGNGQIALNYYCEAYRAFFREALPRLSQLAEAAIASGRI